MQKALIAALSGTFIAASLSAQVVVDPCGPAVIGTPATTTDLNNLAFNVTEVGQLFLIPNPAGPGYLGHATVKKLSRTDWDAMSFTWAGPGNPPVITTDCDALNGTGDEFQCSLSRDGLVTVLDTGIGNINSTIGNHPIIAVRATPSGPFTVIGDIGGGFPPAPGYYDPQLARFDLDQNGSIDDVIYYAAPSGGIGAGIINRTTGVVTNVVTAVAPLTGQAGFQFCHSPTPQYDANNVSHALVFSAYNTSSSSDGYYYPGTNSDAYPTASSFGLVGYCFYNDGTNWDANPALLQGTAYYARAAASYGDPLKVEMNTLSGISVRAATGGSGTLNGMFPLSMSSSILVGAINIGFSTLPTPIPISVLGLNGAGSICVPPTVSVNAVAANAEYSIPLTIPAGLSPGALFAQGVAVDVITGNAYCSNVAYIEWR